jgi:hypothetical protein
MKLNGRRNISHSLYDRHIQINRRLAEESGLSESQIVRELLELVSNCHAVWNGCFLKFERPRFQWGEDERERFL